MGRFQVGSNWNKRIQVFAVKQRFFFHDFGSTSLHAPLQVLPNRGTSQYITSSPVFPLLPTPCPYPPFNFFPAFKGFTKKILLNTSKAQHKQVTTPSDSCDWHDVCHRDYYLHPPPHPPHTQSWLTSFSENHGGRWVKSLCTGGKPHSLCTGIWFVRAGLHDLSLQVLFGILGSTIADGCTPSNSETDIKLLYFY